MNRSIGGPVDQSNRSGRLIGSLANTLSINYHELLLITMNYCHLKQDNQSIEKSFDQKNRSGPLIGSLANTLSINYHELQ
ncbi:MAG: hypothetical protein K9G67_02205 [Bacteroidales bacterium]|nr:hypothetical protein [Bacteroidales bacterium]MCF8343861.1 hypothetical protein [Bacteroidales bacterium]MCF8349584.1 hypothetical protein [Bacteroidales bacterium]MCF8375144.1 hypothetical protein [Bacteroidales bacterium]MCF8400051.1 hypothetical protein [Bacteroidales bacterium]